MSESVTISPDVRSRSSYLPFCWNCSFLNRQDDLPDILHRPHHRLIRLAPSASAQREEEQEANKLTCCCALSFTGQIFASPSDAAAWWRAKRNEPAGSVASDNRRRNCLERLSAAQLEAIE